MKKLLVVLLVLAVMVSLFSTTFAAKKYTIAGIVFQEDQFMQTVLNGMKAAADKYGVELLTANTANQITKEVNVVQTYTARGVDAICITTLDKKASVQALQEANDKGIKIISFNNAIDADFPVSTIASSNTDIGATSGKAAAQYIKTKLKGKKTIKVGICNYKAQFAAESNLRQDGFWNEIKDIPGVTLVAEVSSPLVNEAQKKVGDMITANPDLHILYGCNDGGTLGSALAVKEANKKIAVFGIDIGKQQLQMLLSKDNILQAVTGQDPYKIGYMSLEFAVKSLNGESVPKNVVVPGKLATRTDAKALQAMLDAEK